jgi:hypothetical protein
VNYNNVAQLITQFTLHKIGISKAIIALIIMFLWSFSNWFTI